MMIQIGRRTRTNAIMLQIVVFVLVATMQLSLSHLSTVVNEPTMLNNVDMIQYINNHPKASWQAKEYPQFEGKTMNDLKYLLGTQLAKPTLAYNQTSSQMVAEGRVGEIPTNFDARYKWPYCTHPVRDQQDCGSCWAFSSSSVLSDRLCIASRGAINVVLSPQYQVSCDDLDYGCQGGILENSWRFLSNRGTVEDKCFPYSSGTGYPPECRTRCVNGSSMRFYRSRSDSITHWTNITAVQYELVTNGPVQTGMKVYQDFFQYSKGVYRHLSGSFAGGHAIKVVGFGVDSITGLPYWIAANSWSVNWGQDGYFWILRGSNECDFETNFWSAMPSF